MNEIEVVFEKLSLTASNDTKVGDEEEKIVSFLGKMLNLNTETDAKDVVENIQNCIGMTTLCLGGNTIGVGAAKAIGEALESQSKLKKALWSDIFSRRTVAEIPDALRYLSCGVITANAQLVVLDLSDNAFGPRGIKGIVEFLSSSSCYTLEELYLNNNGLGVEGGKLLASALSDCLKKGHCNGNPPLPLKIFKCGRNRLENEGCIQISEVLKDITTLQHIAMPQNGIYSSGIKHLAKSLVNHEQLVHLNLNDNTFREEGAEEMAKILPFLKNIEVLNFGDCLLRSDGAKALAKLLQNNCPKLKELYLGFNEIDFGAGLEIIKAMSNKGNLKKLNLNGNQFGEKGCFLIQKLLEETGSQYELESLSEDEGSDDDEEEENTEEEEKENTEEAEKGSVEEEKRTVEEEKRTVEEEKRTVEEETEDYNENIFKDATILANRLEEFMAVPTFEKLTALYSLNINKFILLSDLTASECFILFVKAASIVNPENEKTMTLIYDFIDNILLKSFESYSDLEMWKVNSEFAVSLNLVRCEDEPCEIPNLCGLFLLLHHAAKQNYFHSSTRELLKFLLPKAFNTHSSEEFTNLLKYLEQE